ncbi:MAG: phosphoribosyltransferase [Acidimicrobiia bacterium]
MPTFIDRTDAGRQLAAALSEELEGVDCVVLGLPRGGVPVAAEVAHALGAPLDVLVVRKVGVPGQPELAMGAVASGDATVRNVDLLGALGIDDAAFERYADAQRAEVRSREQRLRGDRPEVPVADRTVVVVDDGIATGSTMQAALASLRQRDPARVVVAVPVAPPSACADLEALADEVVCLSTPAMFRAVGQWYDDFRQVGDEEVRSLLAQERETGRR